MDTYRTIVTTGEATFTEKRSKFIAYAAHAADAGEATDFVATLRKKYHDARHVCWAYALGTDGADTRSNDDGEPSGSAGKPILGQLRAAGVTQAVVAVVRYFGGVKLGTGGLAVAYKTAAAMAIENATTEERTIEDEITVFVPFATTDICLRTARNLGAHPKSQEYTAEGVRIVFLIPQSRATDLRHALKRLYSLTIEH